MSEYPIPMSPCYCEKGCELCEPKSHSERFAAGADLAEGLSGRLQEDSYQNNHSYRRHERATGKKKREE